MVRRVTLGCAEFAVPGDTLEDKLRILELHKMWLELVNDGFDEKRLKNILGILPNFKTPIMSVQAFLLHDLRMLSAKDKDQKIAIRHVEETIKIASKVGAQNVVTTITYGEPRIENPRKRCVELFKHFGKLSEEFNVLVSIEPLGRERTTFLPSVSEIYRLVQDVGSEHVRLMADTMHIHSNGENIAEVVNEYLMGISELQLRDTNSRPPGRGSINFAPVLKIIRKNFKGLTCLEYKPGPDPSADFNYACKSVGDIIYAAR